MILIWSKTNWKVVSFFYLNILVLVKLSQYTELFNWKWFSLAFYLLILSTKWQNWLLASTFALYLPICMKFMKLCQKGIKILLALQKDVCTCANNLIYGVRLLVNVRDFQCLAALFWKKNLREWASCRMDTLEKVVWILTFPLRQ